ncbi:hypothetical protein V6Z11_A13G111300 [Gossypium hirsutum]|uniref:Uncharacterized protein n=1 Tax=Gossypium hirsutum TaxID=3635 RepID=A0A1U8II17_GOSHI|nr:uncharacterized protein LOC107894852 [Gossypium hirsutum]
MGNCFTSTKVVAQDDQDETEDIKDTRNVIPAAGVLETKKEKKKKVVSSKVNEENNVDSGKPKDGVVRIRFVVTRKELKQILSSGKDLNKYSSKEELVRAMKLRENEVCDDGFNGAWRPALETIPEEY